jgi:transcriptional regulator with XRE-family HTH domain
MNLTLNEKIKIVIKRKGLSAAELAAKLGCSRQNLFMKFKRNSWTEDDLKRIAEVIGCDVEIVFIDRVSGERY